MSCLLGIRAARRTVIRVGEAFWEPGGDVIHYQAANHLPDQWTRFVVVMLCEPGQEMLVYVDDDELEQRLTAGPRGRADRWGAG